MATEKNELKVIYENKRVTKRSYLVSGIEIALIIGGSIGIFWCFGNSGNTKTKSTKSQWKGQKLQRGLRAAKTSISGIGEILTSLGGVIKGGSEICRGLDQFRNDDDYDEETRYWGSSPDYYSFGYDRGVSQI